MAATPAVPKKKSDSAFLSILIGITIVLVIIFSALGTRLKVPGFLGTHATLGAGLVLIVEIALLIAVWYGRAAVRRNHLDTHRYVQTAVVVVHFVTVSFVMFVTFREQIIGPAAAPGDPVTWLALGHGIFGGLVDLLSVYLLIRMWFARYLPTWLKINNYKSLMQITFYAWTVMVFAGLSIFSVSYLLPRPASIPEAVPTPAAPAISPTPTTPPAGGSVIIRDDRVHSDAVLITLQNVPQPAADEEYVGWLIGTDSGFRLNMGVLKVDADGKVAAEYVSPHGINLLGEYDEFIITREPLGAQHPRPSAAISFSAVMPQQARQPLLLLLVGAPDTQFNRGYLLDVLDAGQRAADHARLAQEFIDQGALPSVRRQGEIIVNLIEGQHGKNFGDVDGDGVVLVDGDGVALWPNKLDRVKQTAQAASDAPDASPSIKLHAGNTIVSVDNARPWAEQLDAKALELAHAKDLGSAQSLALDIKSLTTKLLTGVDMNGDGIMSPIPGEGTVAVAYHQAQLAASPLYQAALTPGGAPLAAAAVVPTPTPTALPEPTAASNEVIVKMKDMIFTPETIAIQVGTKITWINEDSVPHTATADDNSWTTGILRTGQSGSITFTKAGEYPYFCLLHGGPGVGMIGKIHVTQ